MITRSFARKLCFVLRYRLIIRSKTYAVDKNLTMQFLWNYWLDCFRKIDLYFSTKMIWTNIPKNTLIHKWYLKSLIRTYLRINNFRTKNFTIQLIHQQSAKEDTWKNKIDHILQLKGGHKIAVNSDETENKDKNGLAKRKKNFHFPFDQSNVNVSVCRVRCSSFSETALNDSIADNR